MIHRNIEFIGIDPHQWRLLEGFLGMPDIDEAKIGHILLEEGRIAASWHSGEKRVLRGCGIGAPFDDGLAEIILRSEDAVQELRIYDRLRLLDYLRTVHEVRDELDSDEWLCLCHEEFVRSGCVSVHRKDDAGDGGRRLFLELLRDCRSLPAEYGEGFWAFCVFDGESLRFSFFAEFEEGKIIRIATSEYLEARGVKRPEFADWERFADDCRGLSGREGDVLFLRKEAFAKVPVDSESLLMGGNVRMSDEGLSRWAWERLYPLIFRALAES